MTRAVAGTNSAMETLLMNSKICYHKDICVLELESFFFVGYYDILVSLIHVLLAKKLFICINDKMSNP